MGSNVVARVPCQPSVRTPEDPWVTCLGACDGSDPGWDTVMRCAWLVVLCLFRSIPGRAPDRPGSAARPSPRNTAPRYSSVYGATRPSPRAWLRIHSQNTHQTQKREEQHLAHVTAASFSCSRHATDSQFSFGCVGSSLLNSADLFSWWKAQRLYRYSLQCAKLPARVETASRRFKFTRQSAGDARDIDERFRRFLEYPRRLQTFTPRALSILLCS